MASSLPGRFCAVLLHLRAGDRPPSYICSSIAPASPFSLDYFSSFRFSSSSLQPSHSFQKFKIPALHELYEARHIIIGTVEPVTLFWTIIDLYTTSFLGQLCQRTFSDPPRDHKSAVFLLYFFSMLTLASVVIVGKSASRGRLLLDSPVYCFSS